MGEMLVVVLSHPLIDEFAHSNVSSKATWRLCWSRIVDEKRFDPNTRHLASACTVRKCVCVTALVATSLATNTRDIPPPPSSRFNM